MIEYDIDLSNLSKKGKKNFHKYYKKKISENTSRKSKITSIIIFGSFFILPISFGAAAEYICKVYFNYNKDLIPVLFLVLGYLLFFALFFKYFKTTKNRNQNFPKVLFKKYSCKGVFNYCFECNKAITPNKSNQCPYCNHSTRLNLLENFSNYNAFKKNKEYKIINISTFFYSMLYGPLLLLLTLSITSSYFLSSTTPIYSDVFWDVKHNNYQYLQPQNINNESKFIANDILGYRDGIPIREKSYISIGIPKLEQYLFGDMSKNSAEQYCLEYNKQMKKYIDRTAIKDELGPVKTFGNLRYSYQKYTNSSLTLTKLESHFFIDDKVKFDHDKTGLITAITFNKSNQLNFTIKGDDNKNYIRTSYDLKHIK
ncbi:hypothetical protein AAEX28_13095 [Lentisphaerota bacterium WC36G]|nr:hypothetical protein LJT99_15925 [Lentisphaerae bacterium WC36]